MRDVTDLIGRIFLSAIFFFESLDSALYFEQTKESMTHHGLTWNQDMLLYGAILFLFMGGTMVLLGYRSSLGAIMLLMYWIPVTFIIHDFWTYANDVELRIHKILFMKDMAIIGGLLMLLGKGSGRYSVKRLLATTRV
ncbi:MAG: DoxX family protein [Saprospiraceae bacterium]